MTPGQSGDPQRWLSVSLARIKDGRAVLSGLLRLLLAAGAGGAVYAWLLSSPVAPIVVAWYVFEWLLLIEWFRRTPGRGKVLAQVLPRLAGTATALVVIYLARIPWQQAIAPGYVLLLIAEGLYCLVLRLLGSDLCDRLPTRMGRQPEAELLVWRAYTPDVVRAALALLFAVSVPVALYAYGARQVAFDPRFYLSEIEQLGIYEEILEPVGDILVETARSQGGDVRRALELLSEEDVRLGARLFLPREWTLAFIEQGLEATAAWLEDGAGPAVPPISIPVVDIERHLQEAVSTLLDRHLSDMPACTLAMPGNAFCRPEEMSVTAYVAVYKPPAMAVVDQTFALVPAGLDLSTAVTLSPRTFREPLAFFEQVSQRMQIWDRLLPWAGAGCLATLAALWCLSAVTTDRPLLWVSATLSVAGVGAWGASWILSMLGSTSILAHLVSRLLSDPSDLPAALALRMLGGFTRSVHALVSPVEVLVAGVGLLAALVCLVVHVPANRRKTGLGAVRIAVIVLAAGSLLWTQYLALGQRLYDRAHQAYRAGDVAEALVLYRRLARLYPLPVEDYVVRARQERQRCEQFQGATVAYQAGDYETAARQYEALLVGSIPISMRESAEANLVASLYGWADSLREQGAYERALDRYRYVRDAYQERDVRQRIADLYLEWGDSLQDEGDYRAAVATYGRIGYDVSHPRLWAMADGRQVGAYCAWQASLRASGAPAQAARVCDELLAAYPTAAEACAACRP